MVQEELDTIKEKATKEEISRLNFEEFYYLGYDQCIYGQMTGDCGSQRAVEIYPKKFSELIDLFSTEIVKFSAHDFSRGNSFTPLEEYLCMVKPEQHEKLIKYLKGEIETIKL